MRHNTQATADEDLEILSLEPVYLLKDRAAVVAFLQEHLFLIDLLTEAARKIQEYFFHSWRTCPRNGRSVMALVNEDNNYVY